LIRVVVDMNLGPAWVAALTAAGIDAVHWSSVGAPNAPDTVIFEWAARNDRIVITCDLDFSQILAASRATRPSVLILRAQDVTAGSMGRTVASALLQHADALTDGALIMLDANRSRLRMLPVR